MSINKYNIIYIFKLFFHIKISFKLYSTQITYFNYSKNNLLNLTKQRLYYTNHFFEKLLPKNSLHNLTYFLITLFTLNKNILLVDYNYNYNYLPILNKNLLKNSSKNLFKIVKFFNIGAILFLNLNKKKFLFKKFLKLNLVNIVTTNQYNSYKFDYNIYTNTPLARYIIYIYILNIYLKIKNNNLNILWSSIIFFQIY